MLHIGVIVVLYNKIAYPIDSFRASKNNVHLIIVDNTPNQDLCLNDDFLYYIPIMQNKGIGFAQNIGIKKAQEIGCDYIVFFDQDSVIPDKYVANIVDLYIKIKNMYPNLFILGPTLINGRTSKIYESSLYRYQNDSLGFSCRREIISSGSCIETALIDIVGTLDETLFIDYIDFEWCWRAKSMNFISGITSEVTLTHFIGQKEYKYFNQLVIVSSPFRYYFQIRNYIWLCKRRYTPTKWKINTGIRKLLDLIYLKFKVNNYSDILKNVMHGIHDGLN